MCGVHKCGGGAARLSDPGSGPLLDQLLPKDQSIFSEDPRNRGLNIPNPDPRDGGVPPPGPNGGDPRNRGPIARAPPPAPPADPRTRGVASGLADVTSGGGPTQLSETAAVRWLSEQADHRTGGVREDASRLRGALTNA